MALLIKLTITIIAAVMFLLPVQAQESEKWQVQNPFRSYDNLPVEVFSGAGTLTYWGDLSEGVEPTFLRLSFHAGISYYLMPQIAARTSLLWGTLYADDALSDYETHRARNLHFRSRIFELSEVFVYEIFKNPHLSGNVTIKKWTALISPYFFAGAGLLHFNPKARYKGKWVALQPLGTEGQLIGLGSKEEKQQTQPYSLWAVAIPFGGGVKLNLDKKFNMRIEAGARKTFTDYLDDVSTVYPDPEELRKTEGGQTAVELSDRVDTSIRSDVKGVGAPRGNPEYKDWYFDFSVSFSYLLNWKKTSK